MIESRWGAPIYVATPLSGTTGASVMLLKLWSNVLQPCGAISEDSPAVIWATSIKRLPREVENVLWRRRITGAGSWERQDRVVILG